MEAIDPHSSLASLVLDEPARALVLERLGLDYCCHGERSLAEACAQRGVDPADAARLLLSPPSPHSRAVERDWREASTEELCDHIVEAHHDRLRAELPRLADTAATVARVHGPSEPELQDVARVFDRLAADLLEHVEREEQLLFPACRAAAAGGSGLDRQALLDELRDDHADVGTTLETLRELAGGYRDDRARCGTHRALLTGLRELEHDLHQHIHEENNILFPRIRGLMAA